MAVKRRQVVLSACMVIRNGLRMGYPFVEAALAVIRKVDELVVVDGESRDGTWNVLSRMAKSCPRMRLYRKAWPSTSKCGEAIAVATKALGAGLGARLAGCTWRDTNTIGAGMVARGEVALVVATLGLSSGLMTDTTFTVVIIMALATTVITPLLMKLTLRPAEPATEREPAPTLTLAPVTIEMDGG